MSAFPRRAMNQSSNNLESLSGIETRNAIAFSRPRLISGSNNLRLPARILALTLNPSPRLGIGTLKLAPLLPNLGEGVGG